MESPWPWIQQIVQEAQKLVVWSDWRVSWFALNLLPPSAIGFPMHTAPWFALPAYPSDLFRVVSRGGKGSWTATRRSAVPITGQTSSYLQYMNKVQLLCRNRQISAMTERIQNKHSKKRSPISKEISHQLTIRTSFRRGNTNHDSYGNMMYSFSSINSCFTPVVFFCSWLSGMQSFVAVWLMSTSDTWLNLYSKCQIILATTKNQDKKKL